MYGYGKRVGMKHRTRRKTLRRRELAVVHLIQGDRLACTSQWPIPGVSFEATEDRDNVTCLMCRHTLYFRNFDQVS